MTAMAKTYGAGPDVTYEATANIEGGQLVVPAAGSTSTLQGIAVAGAGAANVIGVASRAAQSDANYEAAMSGSATASPGGAPILNIAGVRPELAVYTDFIGIVKYAAAANYGARLKAAAAGAVTPWVTGTDDASLIVGWCAEPGGVSGAGNGLARIHV